MATFQNYATLTYNGQTAVSNLVTGEITSGLRMTKTAIAETYVMGGSVTYALSLINSDASEHDGLILNDDLGAYVFREEMLAPLRYVIGSARCFVNGDADGVTAIMKRAEADESLSGWNKMRLVNECGLALLDLRVSSVIPPLA